ncbi:hypothetical protein [Vibrio sp. WXL103]|uniref:hypothetical protein n=1 Tax=Vibrio sp. WXL103 TaxID=3450710 RepID=UPI003EC69999
MKITLCLAVAITFGVVILVAMNARLISEVERVSIISSDENDTSTDIGITKYTDSNDSVYKEGTPVSKEVYQDLGQVAAFEELNDIDRNIHKAQRKMEREFVDEIKNLPKAEIILAEASYILSGLEQQGIEVTYEPVLLKSSVLSTDRVEIDQTIIEIEEQLINIENTFRSLSDE